MPILIESKAFIGDIPNAFPLSPRCGIANGMYRDPFNKECGILVTRASAINARKKKIHTLASFSAVKLAVRGSLAINIFLFLAKALAAFPSGSLTLLASLLDSTLDLISNILLVVLNQLLTNEDKLRYPVGKHQLEPLGVLIFSTIMASAAANVFIHCISALLHSILFRQKWKFST